MATHDIEVALPAQRVVNADLTVVVKSDGAKLGELLISKGSLDWRPGKRHTAISLPWETFARLMDEWAATSRS